MTRIEHLTPEQEVSLVKRARAGDREAFLDLYASLQPSVFRCATRYVLTYHHRRPSYIEAHDLAQEANAAMLQCMEEASSNNSPAAFLAAVGYSTIRHTGRASLKGPLLTSLDASCFKDGKTPLRESIPSSVCQPLERSRMQDAPLAHAVHHLPNRLRTVLERRIGWGDQPAHTMQEMALQLGKTTSAVSRLERLTCTALYFQFDGIYPQYVEHVLANRPAKRAEWQRLQQACTDLLAQGQAVTVSILSQCARVSHEAARDFFQEREGKQHLISTWVCSPRALIIPRPLASFWLAPHNRAGSLPKWSGAARVARLASAIVSSLA